MPIMYFKTKLKNSIASSFVFYILLFSSFVALISTSIQLFYEYKRDINALEKTAAQIEKSHKSTISQALWAYDTLILESQLKGINSLPGVLYACINKENQILREIGIRSSDEKVMSYTYLLVHRAKNKEVQLGTLEVEISLADVYEHLWDRVILILVTQTLKTFFVSIFILLLFHLIVGRHLNAMASFAKSINLGNLEDKFILNRTKGERKESDELGVVESALNDMRVKLLDEIRNVHRIQDALMESEERFKLAMDANNDGLWDWNIETNNVYCSPAYATMLGYESEQLPPHVNSWMDLIHPDDKIKALKANTDCIENRCNQFQVEFRMRTKNGDWYWILRKGKAVDRDKKGKATRMVGTHRNITDRKNAEDALRKSEGDLKASQRIAHLGSWRLDVKTNEVFWTEELYKMYDFDPTLPPPPYTEHMKLFTPESWELLSVSLEKTKETGIPYELELEMVREDGSQGWMWVRGEAVQDSSGNTIGLWGAAQDISERKRNEEKLSLQSEIINRMSEGVSLVNEDGIIVYTNPTFERMFGYDSGQMTGRHVSILNAPTAKRPEETADDILRMLNSSGQWSGEIQNVKKDKTLFWSVAKVTSLDHPKYGKAFITVQTDISELKKARDEKRILAAQLQQGQKMESIGNLAGGIAHDFNNLLSPIIGMSEMLLEDLPENSLEYGNAREIFKAGKRAGDLVKQILAFSRQSEHKRMPVRIQNVLQEVLKLSRSTIPSNIDIQDNILQNCGIILADATQMHQVIMNLITNASHAVEEKNGVINIVLKEIALKNREVSDSARLAPGQYAKLSVTDNGVGIPQHAIGRIFDPYFTTKEKGKGTGLGLSVVYGIVKDHDGDIKVHSEQGKGTTFEVYLPLMKKFQEAEKDDKNIDISTGSERILLVDDEVSVANLEGQMLSRLGYQVKIETNSFDALNTFKTSPDSFDLVISDMTMPNMTGDQLSQELLSIKPELPIILCTGFSERIDKKTAESIGVKRFLMKPVLKSDLARVIREVFDL